METTPLASMPEQPKNNKSTNVILMILVVILLLGNLATLYFLFKKPSTVPENNNAVVVNENVNINSTTTESLSEFQININWQGSVAKTSNEDVFNINKIENKFNQANKNDLYFRDVKEIFAMLVPYFVGTVSGGKYDASKLYILQYQEMGARLDYILKQNDNIILLTRYSSTQFSASDLIFDAKMDLTIKNFDLPASVKIPNSGYVLTLVSEKPERLSSDVELVKVFTENNFSIYKDMSAGCYLSTMPDGALRNYTITLPFLGQAGDGPDFDTHRKPYLLDIAWSDQSKNKYFYIFQQMYMMGNSEGCWVPAPYIKDATQLKQIGLASNGDPIYELKDTSTKRIATERVSILQSMYDGYYPGENITKISFTDFLASKPLIFWRDPMGYYVEMRRSDYVPMAEMGKPVIYLYPTKTTDVSVKVNPTGGFTKTEPAYGTGWRVLAEPNGKLYNYQDKQNYPYLFWEGYALNYTMPKEGFVVAKNEVNKFLHEKLAIQGLNTQEINDFVEFWLPRMQSDPYYFVTFVPQSEFDQMAPLTVLPQPDSIIRVFMDFKALAKPIQVSEQKLNTPKRTGFTVVEWGGELQK